MVLRVLFADDDPIVLRAVSKSLEIRPEIELIASVTNGREALDILANRRDVDIALLDVDMPRLDGVSTAKEITRLYPGVTVVMFTAFEHDEALGRALMAGAKGFLTKDIPIQELVDALERAHRGEDVVSSRPTSVLVKSMRRTLQDHDEEFQEAINAIPQHLVRVFDGLILAKSNREIAKDLNLQENTVKSYVSDVYALMGCRTRSALAVRALQAGYQPSREAYA